MRVRVRVSPNPNPNPNQVQLATDREGWCRGFAHVHFEDAAGAAQAVRLSGALLEENRLP